ncbi:RNA guanine-N7 methyltransferase activating subunit-like [Dendronephthya gigantea]|uniref:RNA guanine-N7 methyltransferase activating subunit-like n=1 Tax=Dendronephthya gigantea TaxID=151771 RepID=UPI00106ADEBF|nr:RNA guanine-N7 methyltransferase activating subunit-like [Dendronephthya gigantea]
MATLEERLAEYEVLFADRYTERDVDYQKHIAAPVKLPPVVTDWNTSNYDRRRDNRGQGGRDGRGWDARHNMRDNRDNRGYGGRQDYRDRGPRDNRYQTEYKSSGYYEMYY